MSECASTATATLFTTETSISTSTSTSFSTSTEDATTTTSTSTECLFTATDGVCNSTSLVVQTSTIPGVTTTIPVQVPFAITTTLTQATATLFTTSCSIQTSQNDTNTNTNTNTNTGPAQTGGSSVPVSTLTPTTLIASSLTSTFANGSVATELVTITSTLSPTTVYSSSTSRSLSPTQASHNNASNDVGPIVGGAVGGFVGLICLVALVWVVWRRRSARWDDIFDEEPVGPHQVQRGRRKTLDLVEEVEPKPYHYGLVGHPGSNPQVSGSPPPSRPPSTVLDHAPLDMSSDPRGHAPQLSLQAFPPYNLSPSSTQPNTASASRPSTANSMNPILLPQNAQHQRRSSRGAQSLSSGDYGYFNSPPPGPARSQSATAVLPQSPERRDRDRRNSRMSLRPESADMDGAIPLQPRSMPSTPTSPVPGPSRGPLQLVNATEPSPDSAAKFTIPPPRPAKSTARPSSANQVIVHQDAGRVSAPRSGSSQPSGDEPPAYST